MQEEIEQFTFTYEVTLKEYCRAMRLHFLTLKRNLIFLVINLLCLAIAVVHHVLIDMSHLVVLIYSISFVHISRFLSTLFVYPRKAYNWDQRLGKEVQVSFFEEHVYFKSNVSESSTKWQAFLKFLENNQFFLVYFAFNRFIIIPKRLFSDSEHMEKFRCMLKERINLQ